MEKYIAKQIVKALPAGEKWDFETSKQLAVRFGVSWNDVSKNDWYIYLNKMYSAHCMTARRHNIDTELFYVELAIDYIRAL